MVIGKNFCIFFSFQEEKSLLTIHFLEISRIRQCIGVIIRKAVIRRFESERRFDLIVIAPFGFVSPNSKVINI